MGTGTAKLLLPLDALAAGGGGGIGSGAATQLALFLSSNSIAVRYYAGALHQFDHRIGRTHRLDLTLRVASDPADSKAWHAVHNLPPLLSLDAAALARCTYDDRLCMQPDLQPERDCVAGPLGVRHRAPVLELLLAPTSCAAAAAAPRAGFRCGASTNVSDVCSAALEEIRYRCDPRAQGYQEDWGYRGVHSYLDLCNRVGCVFAIGRALGRAEACEGAADSRQGSNWTFPSRAKLSVLLGLCADGSVPLAIAAQPH